MDFCWRDCEEWSKQGLPLSTCSNEAAKFYDITLSQYVWWKEDEKYGGFDTSIQKMISADPNFVMGHVLKLGLEMIGSSKAHNSDIFSKFVNDLTHMAKKVKISDRERNHVEAIRNLYLGNLPKATSYWEEILVEHPTDMLALKFSNDVYFYTGLKDQMRDSVSRVLPLWNSSLPLYSYLYGMHAFGLVQSNFFEKAKSSALKSLELNKSDAWATHALCHYYEYATNYKEGIEFLRKTENDWSDCNILSNHNYWHLCMYHLEQDEQEKALEVFDTITFPTFKPNRMIDVCDAASLLFRLKLDCSKADLRERWFKLKELCMNYFDAHGYAFNDTHILMLISECGNKEEKDLFFESFEKYISEDDFILNGNTNHEEIRNYLKHVNKTLAKPLFDAICHYDQGEYSKVVDCLYPIRYDIHKIGGSNAQRDIFHQLLTQSALRSESEYHNKIGLALINERLAIKPNSNLTKRIAHRFAANHLFD